MSDPAWSTVVRRRSAPRVHLLCFPYGGGSAAAYRAWGLGLPRSVEVVAVNLPGRLGRLDAAPYEVLGELVEDAVLGLRSHFERPFALWGHSMGALVAFEVARSLRRHGLPRPERLLVGGHPAPGATYESAPISGLADEAFVEALRAKSWARAELLEDRELMTLLLPALRADLRAVETHVVVDETPLEVPISVFGGLGDPDTPRARLEGWAQHTVAPCEVHLLPGDHFFVHDAEPVLLALIGENLGRAAGEAAARVGSGFEPDPVATRGT